MQAVTYKSCLVHPSLLPRVSLNNLFLSIYFPSHGYLAQFVPSPSGFPAGFPAVTTAGKFPCRSVMLTKHNATLPYWEKEEYLYSTFIQHLKALRHGSHCFTCKLHHACLSFVIVHRMAHPLNVVVNI